MNDAVKKIKTPLSQTKEATPKKGGTVMNRISPKMIITEEKEGFKFDTDKNGKLLIRIVRSAVPLRDFTTCDTYIDQLEKCCGNDELDTKISVLAEDTFKNPTLESLAIEELFIGLMSAMETVELFENKVTVLTTLLSNLIGNIGLNLQKKASDKNKPAWTLEMENQFQELDRIKLDKCIRLAKCTDARKYAYLGLDLLNEISTFMFYHEYPKFDSIEEYFDHRGIFIPTNPSCLSEILEAQKKVKNLLSHLYMLNDLYESPEYQYFKNGQDFIKNTAPGILFQLDQKELQSIKRSTDRILKKIQKVLSNKRNFSHTEVQMELPLKFK